MIVQLLPIFILLWFLAPHLPLCVTNDDGMDVDLDSDLDPCLNRVSGPTRFRL